MHCHSVLAFSTWKKKPSGIRGTYDTYTNTRVYISVCTRSGLYMLYGSMIVFQRHRANVLWK